MLSIPADIRGTGESEQGVRVEEANMTPWGCLELILPRAQLTIK